MLLVKLTIDRAMAEAEDTKSKQRGALGAAEVTSDAQRRQNNGGLRKEQLAVQKAGAAECGGLSRTFRG
mgnify:CR=1 FL=1